jgi:hypothetical protein
MRLLTPSISGAPSAAEVCALQQEHLRIHTSVEEN